MRNIVRWCIKCEEWIDHKCHEKPTLELVKDLSNGDTIYVNCTGCNHTLEIDIPGGLAILASAILTLTIK